MHPARRLGIGIGTALACAAAWADGIPAAALYRPTAANPAELSALGWIELEAGWLGIVATAADERLAGWGDTNLAVEHRVAGQGDAIDFGIEAGAKMPTARTGLGSGKPDRTLNGIASIDVAELAEYWPPDANLGATRLGQRPNGQGRMAMLWAAALSHAAGARTLV